MINVVYTLNQSEITLLTSLLNQLEAWFEPDVVHEVKYYLELTISSGEITHENINKLLLLLKKSKKQQCHKATQNAHEPEVTSNSWDEMLELMETNQKVHAKHIAIDASHRAHLQSAVYNINLPSKCLLILRQVIPRNKGKQHCLRRHI